MYIVTIHRPPSDNLIENVKLVQFTESFCFGKELVVQGDFNLPDVNWISDSIGSYEVLHCLPSCVHSPVLVHYIYQFLPDSDVASNQNSSIEYL